MQDSEFLSDKLFSSSILHMSIHCLLSSIISDEKMTYNFIENPLYMMSNFSLAAFKILPLSQAFNNFTTICLTVDLWV